MSSISESKVLGDVVKYEDPLNYAREEFEVVRNLTATSGYEVGTPMGPCAAAVAAVQTYTCTGTADGGTYQLGYKGEWTTILAWNATVAQINAALDVMIVLTGGTAGDIVFANVAGDALVSTNTFTFLNTLGNVEDIVIDARLLTDGGVSMHGDSAIATTTAGELTTQYEDLTTASCTAVLLESVSLDELNNGDAEALRRPFLVRGPSIVDVDQVFAEASAGTEAALITALEAVGIQCRTEPDITDTGTPRI